jgi:hypothetical protein
MNHALIRAYDPPCAVTRRTGSATRTLATGRPAL